MGSVRLRTKGFPQLVLEVVLRVDDALHEDQDLPMRVEAVAVAVRPEPIEELLVDPDVELELRPTRSDRTTAGRERNKLRQACTRRWF